MTILPVTPSVAACVMDGQYIGPESLRGMLITSHVLDNREAVSGSMFYCIRGENNDGHKYASSALDAGAVCCVAEQPLEREPYILVPSVRDALQKLASWYRSYVKIPVVAVVGSIGKTTAKEMIAAVLSQRFFVHKTPKNLNSQLGVPITVLGIQQEHSAAVIEIGISEFGQMDTLGHVVKPDITVFTAVAPCHLEFLGDLDGVLLAKSEIFPHTADWLVLSGDDERLASLSPREHTVHFGLSDTCDYRAEKIESLGFAGTRFDIRTPDGRIPGAVHSYGGHLPFAAAGAAAVGSILGMTPEEISPGFAQFIPTKGRANVLKAGPITVIDDCYNSSPATVHQALRALSVQPGRRIAILGDMKELGTASSELHREVGRLSSTLPIKLICCGKESKEIYFGASESGADAVWYPNLDSLLTAIPSFVFPDDVILVKASHSMSFGRVVEALCALGESL